MENRELEFIRSIYKEKENTQAERTKLIATKLGFITVVISLATLVFNVKEFNLGYLFFVAPLISIVFDNYIAAADASIKKIGRFIRTDAASSEIEQRWEGAASDARDRYAPVGGFLSAVSITAFCATMYFIRNSAAFEELPTVLFGGLALVQTLQHLRFSANIGRIDGKPSLLTRIKRLLGAGKSGKVEKATVASARLPEKS